MRYLLVWEPYHDNSQPFRVVRSLKGAQALARQEVKGGGLSDSSISVWSISRRGEVERVGDWYERLVGYPDSEAPHWRPNAALPPPKRSAK